MNSKNVVQAVAAQQITPQMGADALTGLHEHWAEVGGAR